MGRNSSDNAAKLRDALAPHIERGRKAAKDEGTRRGKQRGLRAQVIDSHAVRVWAEANGIKVGAKGRVLVAVIDRTTDMERASANLSDVKFVQPSFIHVYDVLNADKKRMADM